ncbi:MAG: DUF4388 domain-containing protein [Planctomycetes bacterium]|nr:DUF4388 domain-containing protein [Planctomycetota bacterium]
MTSLKGNLNSVDLANIFQMLSMNQREGTLYIFDGQSRKAIYFGRDGVSMLTRGKHKPDTLGRILMRTDKITPEQLRDALKSQDDSAGRMLGQVLVEHGVVTRTDIEDALKTQIEEEVYSLFIWKDAQFEFVEGPPDDEFLGSDGVARLTFNVNSLIMEAAKRVDEWEWIQRVIPSTDEIFRYTGRNVGLDDEIFAQTFSGKVLAAVDGRRSVEEIIQASYVNRFEVTKMLALLLEGGAVETLPVPDLRREAQDALTASDADAAVKYLSRLVALKGDSPEMHRQLAEVFEGRHQLERAAFHYKVYAEILASAGDRVQSFETYRRIVEFLPTDLGAADRMIELFSANPDGLEQHAPSIIAQGKLLAEIYGELGRQSRAIQVLHRVVALGPEDQDLRNRLIQVYLQSGMPGEAIAEYDALAETALALRDYDAAERIYRKILQIDRTREDAQSKLNQILSKKRMRQRGIRLGIAAGVLLVVGSVGGFRAWQWYQDQKQEQIASVSAFGSELADLHKRNDTILDELEANSRRLAGAYGSAASMARELQVGAPHRSDVRTRANDAVQAFHALAGRYPAVPDVEQAHDAAQAIDRKSANVAIQEDKLRGALKRTVDDLYDKLEPWPPAYSMVELDQMLREINSVAEAVPSWQSSDRGQKAQAYARNVAEVLAAFETMKTETATLMSRNDLAAAQTLTIEFLTKFLPTSDIVEQIQIPRTISSRPAGARILVNDEDTGLATPAVLSLPVQKQATVRLVRDGFQAATIDVQALDRLDRSKLRASLRLSIEEVLHKDLAFRTPALGAKLVGAPAITADRLIVPTRGNEAGTFDLIGASRGGLATKSGGGVQVRPLVFDDVVILASYDGMLFPYRLSTGEALAREPLPDKVQADPVQWKDLAIYPDLGGHLTAYSVKSRSKSWTYPASGPGRSRGFATAPVIDGGEILAVAGDGTLCAIDPATGAERRAGQIKDAGATVVLTTGITAAGQFVFGACRTDRTQTRIVMIDRQTFQVRSSFTVDGNVRHAPMVWQGVVYAVTEEGEIESIKVVGDQLQSSQTLRLDAGVRILAEPAIDGGVLYVGDTAGTLWAIDVSGAQPERLFDFRIPGSDKKQIPITTRPVVSETFIVFGAGDNAVYGLKK